MDVWVSILPQKEIVERIGGDAVRVSVLVGPGLSPATYEPTPRQMARLHDADLFLAIGVPFERTLVPRLEEVLGHERLVDGARGVARAPISSGKAAGSNQDGDDGHRHGSLDPHVWLDPVCVKALATTVCEELCRLQASDCRELRARLKAYEAEVDEADERIAALLSPYRGRRVLVFHPAFGYLLRRYGLEQVSVEIDGKEPSAKQLAALVEDARVSGSAVLFVQPQLAGRGARAVAEALGGRVVELDPLAPDLVENLERMAARVAESLREAD